MKMDFKRLQGFSLVEVVLSVGILVIAIIPLLGLLPQGLKSIQVSSEEIQAGYLLETIIEDLKNTPASQSQSSLFGLDLLPSKSSEFLGKPQTIWIDSGWNVLSTDQPPLVSCFQLEIHYTQASEPTSLLPAEALITVQWPPVLNEEKTDVTLQKKGGKISIRVLFPTSQ